MKKIITVILLLFITVLILRFISVTPKYASCCMLKPKKLSEICADKAMPRFDSDGFEIVTKKPSCVWAENTKTEYINKVLPIFKQKCFACHATVTSVPLYSIVPPVSSLIQYDIKEASRHINMGVGFPFVGLHGTTKETLETIQYVISHKTMPPLRYKFMHWNAGLNNNEEKLVLEWVQTSLLSLEKEMK